MDNEQQFGPQPIGGLVNGSEQHAQPLPTHDAPMSTMFDQPGQPQAAPSTMPSTDNNMGSHGAMSSQSQPAHIPPQGMQQIPGPGPMPRTANSSAPQTPMMEVEPSSTTMPRAQSPQSSQGASQHDRPLNVTDALSYLDAVKSRFHDRTDVYNRFLDIMKDFKTQVIDTPGVIERVSQLFNAHTDLIHGFNTFLPVGYRIETGSEGTIVVRTPQGTSTISSFPPAQPPVPQGRGTPMLFHPNAPGAHGIGVATQQASYHGGGPGDMSAPLGMMNLAGASSPNMYPPGPHDPGMQHRVPGGAPDSGLDQQTEFQRAIGYVNKIKNRFSADPETYKMFLELLQRHRDGGSDVQPQMLALLKNDPDLQNEFKEFWPEGRTGILGSVIAAGGGSDWSGNHKRKEASSSFTGPPAKRKKKVVEKEPAPTKPSSSRQNKRPKHHQRAEAAPEDYMYENGGVMGNVIVGGNVGITGPITSSTSDDQAFFERVKKALDNRETYDEFLKLINMFSQDILDMRTLVEKANVFLGEGTDLSLTFRRIIGWEERERLVREPDVPIAGGIQNLAIYVPHGKENLHHKCGPSYRRIPANEAHIACSGRDELCRSVLNDEWVSHPTWASEDNSGFQSHKKNAYEEALHKCEEERHEFDFHLEIMSKTISALENINMKIQQMSNEEKSTFKLKPGLGLPNKSIYQRIIKKVYGKDPGMEVVATLHDCPAVAVPIVLQRLKVKDEDWRRAQREWNKVWREIDARNFYKSLDHQGVTFKATDKKAMTSKALVATIEAARDEQISERAKLVDPSFARTKPTYQLAYCMTDLAVMKDTTKLILSYLDRLGAHYSLADREKIEKWLIEFLVVFFVLDKAEFEDSLKDHGPGHEAAAAVGALGVTNMVPVDAGGLSMELDPANDAESAPSGPRTPTRKGKTSNGTGVNSNDLRKSLLSRATSGAQGGSRPHSAKASPVAAVTELPTVGSSVAPDVNMKSEDTMPVDSVWINTQPDPNEAPISSVRASSSRSERKATFFGNTIAYVVLRIFQTLYSRLLLCKGITTMLAVGDDSHTANPIAHELGLLEGLGPGSMNLFAPNADAELNPDGTSLNPVTRFYDHMLECCENLFVGDMDQNTFEENLRFMFGAKGYLMFTVDKVIASLVKQVHTAITDAHTEELLILLKRERKEDSPTTQQIITYRRNAEEITGQDDNLFRLNWDHGVVTMQLLGKSDPSTDDVETIAQRWRFYIESYVLTHPTEGVRREVKNPFLRRNVFDAPLTTTGCEAYNGLEIRICIRTYRLFWVQNTEDYFWRYGDGARKQAMEKVPAIEEKRKASFESWLDAKRAKKDRTASIVAKPAPSSPVIK